MAEDRFLEWGGIPCYVLQFADDKAQQQLLQDAINSVDLNAILHAVGKTEAGDQASHRLIHMVVENDFLQRQYKFASDVVAQGLRSLLQNLRS